MSSRQENAKLEAIKKSWQQRREITEHLSKIKTKIAVYSGKGGVGKTTIAVNLSVVLANLGNKVGILDADIDCPNVTKSFGVTEKPIYQDGKMIPSESFGVKVLSMGYFQENEDEAIIWRGPMIHNAITQFLQNTDWGELDYLIVDLPPGTSDAPLTIMQNLPLDGFVVVATPQNLAKLDAKRSINMVKKLKLKVLGIVENFSGEIFGSGAGMELASEMDLPFLGALSLMGDYRDTSKPTALVSQAVLREYKELVLNVQNTLNISQ